MPLSILLDENLRGGAIWNAVELHQATGEYPLDVVRVGDANGPAAGIDDAELLEWAAVHARILISLDKTTLPQFLLERVRTGDSSPGLILLHETLSAGEILQILLLISYGSTAPDWANTYQWIP
ncbi:MAG: hypothetical protein SFU86_14475 [Pirellulaceae bacterium]|nr:hypothetical protein [Pirellulaceae bacterium]